MTTAILIYHQSINDLQEWIRSKKKHAYILQVTEDWTGLLIENDLQVGEKWARKADFWENGERQIHIDLPFKQPRKAKVDCNGVERWRVYASHHKSLEQLYTRLSSSDRLEPGGVDLLKSAFGLENLTFLSYDYLCTYSEDTLAEEGIVEVNGKKKAKLKQVILEIIGKQLEEKGYRLDPASGG